MSRNLSFGLIAFLCIYFTSDLFAQQTNDEMKAKALYIFNFPRYVEWPNDDEMMEIKIGVIGDAPALVNELKHQAKSGYPDGTSVKILTFTNIAAIQPTQILYVTAAWNNSIKSITDAVRGKRTLIITDQLKSKKMTMINFMPSENGKVKFEINTTAISAEKMRIDSKILTREGDEIVMLDLYKESEAELETEKQRAESQRAIINRQNQEIETQTRRITKQKDEIVKQKDEIDKQLKELERQKAEITAQEKRIEEQKEELKKLAADVKAKQDTLLVKTKLVKEREVAMATLQKQMSAKEKEIALGTEKLESLNREASLQETRIKAQKALLDIQSSKLTIQRYVMIIGAVILLLIIGLAFFIYRSYKIKKQANRLLEEKNAAISRQNVEISRQKGEIEVQANQLEQTNHEINEQKQKLQNQNEQITASINYGLTIQQAMLPSLSEFEKAFEYFIVYIPKDIVSGDFYWLSYNKDASGNISRLYVAVVDCTGHGVPGAFMSMIGNRLLNEIVNERRIEAPNEILEQLNLGIRTSLKQDVTDNNDGMDVCLCRLDRYAPKSLENKTDKVVTKITFAGAKRPLFYFVRSEMKIDMLKGDLRSIGRTSSKKRKDFENYELTLQKGDAIYLTSDGIIDQHAPNRKRFGTAMLTELMQTIGDLNMQQQKEIIEEALQLFKQDQEQRDDITLLGIRI